jgi:hypothetical protein
VEISAELQRQQRSPWRHRLRQAQAYLIDLLLLTLMLLMVEFLFVAFSGRRGPTGLLVTPEEILDLLHYGWAVSGGAFLALLWGLGSNALGTSPGRALVLGIPEREGHPPWTHTLRGWFIALMVQLTVFTGWLITEVQLVTFLTQFSKASDIVRGLLHPSSSVLHQGLVLLVQTVFLAFMATAFAIPVAFCLSFLAARNLTRDTFLLRTAYTLVRAGMNFTRAVEPLVWALIFISWVGIGPFAGVLALWVHYHGHRRFPPPGPAIRCCATGDPAVSFLHDLSMGHQRADVDDYRLRGWRWNRLHPQAESRSGAMGRGGNPGLADCRHSLVHGHSLGQDSRAHRLSGLGSVLPAVSCASSRRFSGAPRAGRRLFSEEL